MHHGHQCIVFELLSLNLYELLRNCFPASDHQVLTRTGFMGLEQVEQHFKKHTYLSVACPRRDGRLEYHSITRDDVTIHDGEHRHIEFGRSPDSPVSLAPTDNHRMYVRLEKHHQLAKQEYAIHTAGAVFQATNTNQHAQVQFLSHCPLGITHDRNQPLAPRVSLSHLSSADLLRCLHSYGFWLGSSSHSAPGAPSPSPSPSPSAPLDSSWLLSADSALTSPLLIGRTKEQLRHVLRGVCDGIGQATRYAPDEGDITVGTEELRDFVVQLCIHAGYSAYFESESHPNSARTCWLVHYTCAPLGAAPILDIAKDCASRLVVGRVWCVTVPTEEQLIIFRRVVKQESTAALRCASRPIVVGNTRFTGISLKLIGKFTHQLLMTLAYLSCQERGEERIIHCDLKPENILLVSQRKMGCVCRVY